MALEVLKRASLLAAIVGCVTFQAHAEFEIPQVDAEKGEIEVEYRGAQHWGAPAPNIDGEVDAVRQSHEVEFQYAVTDYWMVRATPNFEQPFGGDLDIVSIGLETQLVVVPRRGG